MRLGRNYLLSMVDTATGRTSALRRFWLYRNAKKVRDIMIAESYGRAANSAPRFRFTVHRHHDY